ncbi:MAG: CPBP family glutamic-type intramembrane protease, partial [Candidatus Omnitrophota bacterium]
MDKMDKRDSIMSLMSYKQSILIKAVACLLIFIFTINSAAYGFDNDTFDRIRKIETSGKAEVENAIREKDEIEVLAKAEETRTPFSAQDSRIGQYLAIAASILVTLFIPGCTSISAGGWTTGIIVAGGIAVAFAAGAFLIWLITNKSSGEDDGPAAGSADVTPKSEELKLGVPRRHFLGAMATIVVGMQGPIKVIDVLSGLSDDQMLGTVIDVSSRDAAFERAILRTYQSVSDFGLRLGFKTIFPLETSKTGAQEEKEDLEEAVDEFGMTALDRKIDAMWSDDGNTNIPSSQDRPDQPKTSTSLSRSTSTSSASESKSGKSQAQPVARKAPIKNERDIFKQIPFYLKLVLGSTAALAVLFSQGLIPALMASVFIIAYFAIYYYAIEYLNRLMENDEDGEDEGKPANLWELFTHALISFYILCGIVIFSGGLGPVMSNVAFAASFFITIFLPISLAVLIIEIALSKLFSKGNSDEKEKQMYVSDILMATAIQPPIEEGIFRFIHFGFESWLFLKLLQLDTVVFTLPIGILLAMVNNGEIFWRSHDKKKSFVVSVHAILYCYAYFVTGSLITPIIMHVLWNTLIACIDLMNDGAVHLMRRYQDHTDTKITDISDSGNLEALLAENQDDGTGDIAASASSAEEPKSEKPQAQPVSEQPKAGTSSADETNEGEDGEARYVEEGAVDITDEVLELLHERLGDSEGWQMLRDRIQSQTAPIRFMRGKPNMDTDVAQIEDDIMGNPFLMFLTIESREDGANARLGEATVLFNDSQVGEATPLFNASLEANFFHILHELTEHEVVENLVRRLSMRGRDYRAFRRNGYSDLITTLLLSQRCGRWGVREGSVVRVEDGLYDLSPEEIIPMAYQTVVEVMHAADPARRADITSRLNARDRRLAGEYSHYCTALSDLLLNRTTASIMEQLTSSYERKAGRLNPQMEEFLIMFHQELLYAIGHPNERAPSLVTAAQVEDAISSHWISRIRRNKKKRTTIAAYRQYGPEIVSEIASCRSTHFLTTLAIEDIFVQPPFHIALPQSAASQIAESLRTEAEKARRSSAATSTASSTADRRTRRDFLAELGLFSFALSLGSCAGVESEKTDDAIEASTESERKAFIWARDHMHPDQIELFSGLCTHIPLVVQISKEPDQSTLEFRELFEQFRATLETFFKNNKQTLQEYQKALPLLRDILSSEEYGITSIGVEAGSSLIELSEPDAVMDNLIATMKIIGYEDPEEKAREFILIGLGPAFYLQVIGDPLIEDIEFIPVDDDELLSQTTVHFKDLAKAEMALEDLIKRGEFKQEDYDKLVEFNKEIIDGDIDPTPLEKKMITIDMGLDEHLAIETIEAATRIREDIDKRDAIIAENIIGSDVAVAGKNMLILIGTAHGAGVIKNLEGASGIVVESISVDPESQSAQASSSTSAATIGSEIEIGEPINALTEVPGLYAAVGMLKIEDTALWERTERFFYDEEAERYRLRWAKGLPVPMRVRRVEDEYEILIDETYRNNPALESELRRDGFGDTFVTHHALCMDMALRQIALSESGALNGQSPRAVEAAKVMATRTLIQRNGAANLRPEFLGTAKKQGLAAMLDETCPNGHPDRFTKLYNMLYYPGKFSLSTIQSHAERSASRINKHIAGLMPDVKGDCRLEEFIPLFMEINPVDGRIVAKEICDEVVRNHKAYLHGRISKNDEWPNFRLTYPEELAIFREIRDNPANPDAKNALVHCNARTVKFAVKKVASDFLLRRTKLDVHDIRQLALVIVMNAINGAFKIEEGTRFNTYIVGALNPVWVVTRILEEHDKLSRGGIYVRGFIEDKDGRLEVDDYSNEKDLTPLDILFTQKTQGHIKRYLAILSARERLIIKLLYGIRFEGDPVLCWAKTDIARLIGTSKNRVDQILDRAYEKMRAVPRGYVVKDPLTDGDIYLALDIGLSPNSKFFPVFAKRDTDWLKQHGSIIAALVKTPQRKTRAETEAAPWLVFGEDLKRSTQGQARLLNVTRQKKPLAESETKKYNEFKRLVADYIYGKFDDPTDRDRVLARIVSIGTLRVPIHKAEVKRRGTDKATMRRIVNLSEFRAGNNWRIYNTEFDDIVYVTPRIVGGKLNIVIKNSRTAAHEVPLCNSYWDDQKKGVTVSQEFAEFFTDSTDRRAVPSRQLARHVIMPEGAKKAQVNMFEIRKRKIRRVPIYINPAYAYIDVKSGTKRALWFSAFRDGKGKGVTVHLTPDGPPVGKAYYENGGFVPERGPLLRSRKHSVLTPDKSDALIDRLRMLEGVENSAFVLPRQTWANRYKAYQGKDAGYSGEEKTSYYVTAFGMVGNQISMITVSETDEEQKTYYSKYIPYDSAIEVYPTEDCIFEHRITRKFYDLDTLKVLTAKQELRRRFGRLLKKDVSNPIVCQVNFDGRLYLSKDLWVNMSKENRMKPYYIRFGHDEASGVRSVSIYEMDNKYEDRGLPVGFARCVHIKEEDGRISLQDAPGFTPYKLAAPERILIQEEAQKLGYAKSVDPITLEEEALVNASLDELESHIDTEEPIIDEGIAHDGTPVGLSAQLAEVITDMLKAAGMSHFAQEIESGDVRLNWASPESNGRPATVSSALCVDGTYEILIHGAISDIFTRDLRQVRDMQAFSRNYLLMLTRIVG